MNDEELEDLMYRAGLTAQGCWDSMDQYAREAIMDFAKRVAAAEREAVLKLADELGYVYVDDIRARGENMTNEDEEFTREDVVSLLLEAMDWTYVQADRDRPMTDSEKKVIDDIRTALTATIQQEQPR